jgi:hypothetical protein
MATVKHVLLHKGHKVYNVHPDAPVIEAVTETVPARVFAVTTGDVAMPLASVGTVAGPPKVTLGPLVGAANVTAAFATGFPKESCTLARSGDV